MDKNKQPGISFDKVFLSKLNYELPEIPPDKFKYKIDFLNSYKINKGKLVYSVTIQLYDKFTLEITGIFSIIKDAGNMPLEEFAKVNAPTLLIPFAREIISSITAKSPLPHLLLPPINILALSKKSKPQEPTKKQLQSKKL